MNDLVRHFQKAILCILIIFLGVRCKPDPKVDPDQALRMAQLQRLAEDYNLDLGMYSLVLVEGQVKCGGCAAQWTAEFPNTKLLSEPSLIVLGDSVLGTHPLSQAKNLIVLDFDELETRFPYIANYFVFYIEDAKPKKYIELGARLVKI